MLLLTWPLMTPLLPANTLAVDTPAADAVLEQRVRVLAEELRCLVCQNQTLADSHAELATYLKHQIREKLKQGMNEQAILAFMVERYGDFVLYRPPLKATTLLLWFGPALLLLAGLAALFLRLRSRRNNVENKALSVTERARAVTLLNASIETELR